MRHVLPLVAAAGIAILMSPVAPASAEPDSDALFISAIEQAGIEYTNPADAIAVGREVCDYLGAGHHSDAAARAVRISNRSMSVKNAARFVTFSQVAFCPDSITD
ncbi:DUF732 domain-containing protein [Mycolicibacter arupensis]|uniref:DUF732 domain-containing protein n=1 Tax=Mycolicibacter arupensis TaxID=342002 RepID=UPI003B3B1D2C